MKWIFAIIIGIILIYASVMVGSTPLIIGFIIGVIIGIIQLIGSMQKTKTENNNDYSVSESNTFNPEELLQYKKLLDAGAISKEEYEEKKKELLG